MNFALREQPLSRPGACRGLDGGRRRGAMLIIALGVLALMVILGTAFASLMRLEKRATENYVEATRMNMLVDSSLERVIAQLQGVKNFKSWTSYREAPWLFMLKHEQDLAHGRVGVEDDRVGKWEVFAEQAAKTYAYKTKVIDCQAQIDLNGRQDTLARMLDNLGTAIAGSTRLKIGGKKVYNPLYTKPRQGGNKVRGQHIVQIRRRLPDGKFESKSDIKQIIGPENYELIKDFVTVRAWEDPDTYKAADGLDEVVDPTGLGATGVAGGGGRSLGGGNAGQAQQPAYMIASRLEPEPRHPININTAPEEVLIAAIQGVAGRRAFPFSKLGVGGGGVVPADQNANIQGQRVIAQEEVRDVTPRAVFVYSPRFEYTQAQRLAREIIRQRKMRAFMTWRTNNENGIKGFEDFINDLTEGFFPAASRCEVIDPDMPLNRQLNGYIMGTGGTTPIGRLWVKGHAIGTTRNIRKQLSLPMHDQYAWYYDMIKGILNANFNPNTRINRCNPNSPAYVPVDKSDLVWAQDRTHLWKGHTTEFCFDTMGRYEVTTLARISGNQESGGSGGTTGGGASKAFSRPAYEKKFRSVIQVFDVLRHTNQFQFEKSFRAMGKSSKGDRQYVVTWPEPMAALTELGTAGSRRDGRVELAGLNDGLRLLMPPQMRMQYFRNFQTVLMGIGFQDRDGRSYATLKRIRTSGSNSLATSEYNATLHDVLNAYNRNMTKFGEYYRREKMAAMSVFKNTSSVWRDPLVAKEVMGTDVYPDGLNSNLFRMSHLGLRHLVLPARGKIGDAALSRGGNLLIGESGRASRSTNVLGNVPYHHGGIAFWVKFEFNGDDPVFSGLIGCTEVIRQVSPNAADYTGSEGTQFFVFKNSVGELRVVRMYYHQAFVEGSLGSDSGSSGGSGVRLYPDPGATDGGGGGTPGQNPILNELDPKKVISRSDIVFNAKHFQAHEWHHVAIDWDDQNVAYPIRLYLDFQEVREAVPRMPQSVVDATANSWVRLNERQPKDGLQIGGIVREQGVADAGVFKWFTNTERVSGAGGVRTITPSVKRILANATIDELITYEGTFGTVRQFYGGRGSPGYFSVQPGRYANVFEVPLPENVDSVVLRSFDWTSYYPATYTDSRVNSIPQPFPQKTPIQCDLSFRSPGAAAPQLTEPWRNPSAERNPAAGRRVMGGGQQINKNKAEVVYRFNITGSRPSVGSSAGGVVQTPVIDDVTLTYFLPHPKILITEEVD